MSVSQTTNLPDQPTVGICRARPLGGNGFQSPFAQQIVQAVLIGDASASNNTITVNLDPTYLNLVSMVQLIAQSASGDVTAKVTLTGPDSEFLQLNATIPFLALAGSLDNALLWTPPPLLFTQVNESGDGFVQMTSANADGQTMWLNLWIYQFSKRADEYTPVETLLAPLSRGSTLT